MFAAIKHLFRLQFFIILLAALAGIYYQEIIDSLKSMILTTEPDTTIQFSPISQHYIFPKAALAKFTGETEDQPIYLSILGSVYDVTQGRKHYGPGCSYGHFAGRDASKSFITGDFTEYSDDSDDVMSLSPSEILSLYEWKKFYDKEYIFKGLVIGRFYDKNGKKTKYHRKLDAIANQAQLDKINENQLNAAYPACNIEWSEQRGTRVWCTKQSGGTKRDWVGVPRKFYQHGTEAYRCACIKESDLDAPHIQPYEDCDRLSHTCFYKVN